MSLTIKNILVRVFVLKNCVSSSQHCSDIPTLYIIILEQQYFHEACKLLCVIGSRESLSVYTSPACFLNTSVHILVMSLPVRRSIRLRWQQQMDVIVTTIVHHHHGGIHAHSGIYKHTHTQWLCIARLPLKQPRQHARLTSLVDGPCVLVHTHTQHTHTPLYRHIAIQCTNEALRIKATVK